MWLRLTRVLKVRTEMVEEEEEEKKGREVGVRLMKTLMLSQRRLMIKEDVNFIQELGGSTDDKERPRGLFNLTSLSVAFALIAIVCGLLLHSRHGLLVLTVTMAAVVGSFIAGKRLVLWYYTYLLEKQFRLLCNLMEADKRLVKQLMQMVEEAEVVEKKSETFSPTAVKLRNDLAKEAKCILSSTREATLKSRERLPALPQEIDGDYNYLCCLPVEMFHYMLDNESHLTVTQLKSLVQLVRLHQSEFLRRMLCVFLLFDKNSSSDFINVCRGAIAVILELRISLETSFRRIKLLLNFHNAYWFRENNSNSRTYSSPEETELSFSIKNTKTNIQMALLRLQEGADLMESEVYSDVKQRVLLKLAETLKELERGSESVKHISRLLSKEKMKPFTASIDVMDTKSRITEKYVDLNKYIPDIHDEVFEAYLVDDEDHEQGFQPKLTEDEWDQRVKSDASVNLLEELKTALVSKAQEHQEREAKALGVPPEAESAQQPLFPKNESEKKAETKKGNIYEGGQCNDNARFEEDIIRTSSDTRFATVLAKIAAEKSKEFAVYFEGENFGDESNDSSSNSSRCESDEDEDKGSDGEGEEMEGEEDNK